jgi:hypothetical protein
LTGTDTYAKQLAVTTKETIAKVEIDLQTHKEAVISMLMKSVTDVNTDVPKAH